MAGHTGISGNDPAANFIAIIAPMKLPGIIEELQTLLEGYYADFYFLKTRDMTFYFKVIGEPLKNGSLPGIQVDINNPDGIYGAGKPTKAAKKTIRQGEISYWKAAKADYIPKEVMDRFNSYSK